MLSQKKKHDAEKTEHRGLNVLHQDRDIHSRWDRTGWYAGREEQIIPQALKKAFY